MNYEDNQIVDRMAFVRRVFSILFVQLLVTFGIVCIFSYIDAVGEFAQSNPAILWTVIVFMFVFVIMLACCQNLARNYPTNVILLGVITMLISYLLGAVASTYTAESVVLAILITLVVTLALVLFAFQTKIDFTMLNGILFVSLIVLILFGILSAIWCSGRSCEILHIVYAAVGALIFSTYIVVDTQMILGGNHKYQYAQEDYVFAALSLYLDIVNLFLMILGLSGNRD